MPPAHPATKWDPDPNDPTVRRWRENLARGSAATGDSWFRALRRFCGESQITPSGLLDLSPKALRDRFLDFAAADETRGRGGSYTAYTLKVVRNWLSFNSVSPPTGVKIRDADRVFEETALSPDQLRAVIGAARPREKVAILLIGQSGLRPEVLGNFLGTDGLVIGDFPELLIAGGDVRFRRLPSPVWIRRTLSKASHRYASFVGTESGGAIVDLLRARLTSGESINSVSPLYSPDRTDLTDRKYVRTTKIGSNIRRVLRTVGLQDRPYVLRTTAASRYAECENRGLCPHSYWQFWLGHTGDMSARYSVNRGQLPGGLLEELRGAWKRCEPFLSTYPMGADKDETKELVKVEILKAVGFPPPEAEKLARDPAVDVGAVIREKLAGAHLPEAQRIVQLEDARDLLAAGWRVVTAAAPGMLVLDPPA